MIAPQPRPGYFDDDGPWLTQQEAAATLGVPRAQLIDLTDAGMIECSYEDEGIRYRERWLYGYIYRPDRCEEEDDV